MPLQEKYDKLYDFLVTYYIASYAFNKEQGIVDKWPDYFPKVQSKMMPSYMGSVFKLMKMVSPGRSFKMMANQFAYMFQMEQPLSDIEITSLSDSEFEMRFKNCEMLKRTREIIKKTGLNIDPKEICEYEKAMHTSPDHPMTKDFGIVMDCEFEENGCKWIMKLK